MRKLVVVWIVWGMLLVAIRADANLAERDFTDLWWTPTESGWGMQLVQAEDVIYATVYIYGSNAEPTWISATLSPGGGFPGQFRWSGDAYLSTGPWYGAPFDPAHVTRRRTGELIFFPYESGATVSYTIDGVTVVKAVERLSLRTFDLAGVYYTSARFDVSGPVGCGAGRTTYGVPLVVRHFGDEVQFEMSLHGGAKKCTYRGPYVQDGKLGSFSGQYSCTDGETGTMRFFELAEHSQGITARFEGSSTNGTCHTTGGFAAMRTSPL